MVNELNEKLVRQGAEQLTKTGKKAAPRGSRTRLPWLSTVALVSITRSSSMNPGNEKPLHLQLPEREIRSGYWVMAARADSRQGRVSYLNEQSRSRRTWRSFPIAKFISQIGRRIQKLMKKKN